MINKLEKVLLHILSSVFVVLILLIIAFVAGKIGASAIVTEAKQEEVVWDILSEYSPNDKFTAAIMAAICQESGYKSNACYGYYLMPEGFCEKRTEKIDLGLNDKSTKEAFCYRLDYCGYGLLQWCDVFELEKLYDYASEYGESIGDANMQCSFIISDLEKNYSDVYEAMLGTENVKECARIFTVFYVGTSLGERIWGRGDLAEEIYERFAESK